MSDFLFNSNISAADDGFSGASPTSPRFRIRPVGSDNGINAEEKAAGVTVSGLANAGELVRITWGSVTQSVAANAAGLWSTTFASGQVPADGLTSLTAASFAPSGAQTGTVTLPVTVDTKAPLAPAIIPISGDNGVNAWEKAAGVTVTGTAEANATVQVGWGDATRTTKADATGKWSTQFASADIPADGATTVTAQAIDAVGNRSAIGSRGVIVDTVAPLAPVFNAVGGDNVVNAAEKAMGVIVSGAAEAGSRLTVGWGVTQKTVIVSADGRWSANFAAPEIPADGTSRITASAVDPRGNLSTTATQPVRIDTRAPAGTTLAAIAGDDVVSAAERLQGVTVTGSKVESGATVLLSWNDQLAAVQANASGNWSYQISADRLPPGNVRLAATVADQAGNRGLTSTRDFAVAPDAPTIALVAGDDQVNKAESLEGVDVTGTAASGATVKISWGAAAKLVSADASGSWVATFDPTEIPASGSSQIMASSAVGTATSTTTTRDVVIDTLDPSRPRIKPVSDDGVISPAERLQGVLFAGTADPLTSIRLRWSGYSAEVVTDQTGAWSYLAAADRLPTGPATLQANAVDAAGNVSLASARSFVVTDPLPLTMNSVAGDNFINAVEARQGVVISGAALPNVPVTLTWADTTIGVVAGADGRWSTQVAPNAIPQDGVTKISASYSDPAGGSVRSLDQTVTVDTQAPTRLVVLPVTGDDRVTLLERAGDAVDIAGRAEPDSFVTVAWSGQRAGAKVDASGEWHVYFPTLFMPDPGVTSLTVTNYDRAGNVGPSVTRTVVVEAARSAFDFSPSAMEGVAASSLAQPLTPHSSSDLAALQPLLHTVL